MIRITSLLFGFALGGFAGIDSSFDDDLLLAPIVVIGKNIGFVPPNKIQLEVSRALRGEPKQRIDVYLMPYIGISEDDHFVTDRPIPTVSVPTTKTSNIWFLAKRPMPYPNALWLDSAAAHQELRYVEYFEKRLSEKSPTNIVCDLLDSRDINTQWRTLTYLSGGQIAWPLSDKNIRHSRRSAILADEAIRTRLRALSQRGARLDIRSGSLAVYGAVYKSLDFQYVSEFLRAADADVRAVAIGILARHRYSKSYENFRSAVARPSDPAISIRIIEEFGLIGDIRLRKQRKITSGFHYSIASQGAV